MNTSDSTAVRSTDGDALLSRYSAHLLGYIQDPLTMWFLPASVRRSTTSAITRRPPLINLGTHARTYAVDCLVNQFLLEHQHSQPQVLSLGSGTDTRFWRFRSDWNTARRPWTCSRWVEVDFEEATSTKSRTISTKPEFKASLGDNIKLGEYRTLELSSDTSLTVASEIRTRRHGFTLVFVLATSARLAVRRCNTICDTFIPPRSNKTNPAPD